MMDEPKEPPKAAEGGETPKPAADSGQASAPPVKPAASAPKPPAPASAAAPPSAKPPVPAAKPPAAAKAPVKPDPWSSPLLDELQKRFPGAIGEAVIFRKMPSLTVTSGSLLAIGEFLKGDEGGAYTLLTDETGVDYPKREKRFEVVYHLYSFQRNDRLRLKVLAGEGEKVPSVTGLWPTANWLEREIYDMFGVLFEGHPDLRRILLPEEWTGYPLRKDYDILRQDEAWVEANLKIKSGQ